jgi:uncharacterized membrane protein YhiD involved in acid resistance
MDSGMFKLFAELFVFVACFTIIIILIVLIHYNSIDREVKRKSRCYRERTKNRDGNVYTLSAMDPEPHGTL